MTQEIAEKTLEELRAGLESSIKDRSALLMNADMADEILFAEYGVNSPIHNEHEDGNFSSTISGLEISSSGHLVFQIDSSYSDYEVLIEEISLENLIYILGELESLTDHLD